jgi:transglutaminase-like putative cysteine protease
MEYRKDKRGWGRGDATWASQSRCGNCSDFHSLFISLARANCIPAKFEIGFALPPEQTAGDVPGYHCWAKFKARPGEWVPVDISEAKRHPQMRDYYFGHLTADRVVFSTGRDLVLEPKQDGPAINFFVYPYVEVDGKPWPEDRVVRHFTFSDVEHNSK